MQSDDGASSLTADKAALTHVLVVFGTRPEAIKMCPVVQAIQAEPLLSCTLCVTGQHREMLDQVLDAFGVEPDYDLAIMKEGQSLAEMTSAILERIDDVFAEVQPDIVLVHGDTTTSFATALAAFYRQVPVGHVEAGLRTRDLYSPYPEEFNRVVIDKLADWCFAPTDVSRQNLLDDGIAASKVYVTGNTGIDALMTTVKDSYEHPMLSWAGDSRLLLVTAHRRENLGEPMRRMLRGIRTVLEGHPDVKALYPVHLNPLVREVADEVFGTCDQMRLIEPLDVLDFHNFMARCDIVLTDSGGIQEEAPALGKPVLVMRDTTERPEGVEAGTLKLVGTDENEVVRQLTVLLEDDEAYLRMARASNPYGDGFASRRIAGILANERASRG